MGQAAANGNSDARRRIEQARSLQTASEIQTVKAAKELRSKEDERRFYNYLKFVIVAVLTFLLLSLLFPLFFKQTNVKQIENHYYEKDVYHHTSSPNAVTPAAFHPSPEPSKPPLNKADLALIVLSDAAENFNAAHGRYPASASELAGNHPDNWISFIPDGADYKSAPNGFSVSVKGASLVSSPDKLGLDFYPESNQLALAYGGQILALYPSASNKTIYPPSPSTVKERVANPNGGGGALGTRGLALGDDFAVHGTNNPASIGGYGTLGCVRLLNKDIESLYPYVPLGTPFSVKKGKPTSSPVFQNGLPAFSGVSNESGETNPRHRYHWKN